MTTTIDANAVHQQMWDAAIAEHGSVYAVPPSHADHISEVVRGLTILNGWSGGPNAALAELTSYMVREAAKVEVLAMLNLKATVKQDDTALAVPTSRAARYRRLDDLAATNFAKEFTTEELMEQSGFSYPTILKYLKDSRCWRKAGRGRWEARNPSSDRKYEKANA